MSNPIRILFMFAACLCASARSQTVPAGYFVETVATGLSQPTTIAFASPTTILVAEKATGKLKVITNGVYTGDAIDLAVNSSSERGLLGICLDPAFSSNNYVYLYYTKSSTAADTSTSGTWTDNRVEKFVWNGSTLSYFSTLLVVGVDGTQSNGPNHDGGIIMIGPDLKLYVIMGELNRGRFANPRIETNTGTVNAAGCGCIFRLNLDGTTPADNPFILHANTSIQKMYAYGVRNSFGMTFDPITNYVWFTENGPNVYDEVNVIPSPGMNSGWLKLMGPDSRNATYTENNNTVYNASDLTVLAGSYYRDPVFSWLTPVAVTSILFLTTPKVVPADLDKCLIGDNNFGNLYLFTPNPTRDGFVLSGTIADMVADSTTERNLSLFGTGWGAVTDLEIAPDKYIYAVSLTGGVIRRIRPVVEDISPAVFSLLRGSVTGGGLADVITSNDSRLQVRPGAVFSNSEAPIQVVFTAASPFLSPAQLQFTVEAQASASNITQTISLWNYANGVYDELDSRTATMTDSTATVTVAAGAANYVDQTTMEIKTKVAGKAQGAVFLYPWILRIDLARWTITH